MITLIHGDDLSASRTYFINLRQGVENPVSFTGDSVTLTDLAQALQGGGLFATENNIFIEDLITKRKKSKEFEEIITYLQNQNDANVYLWESKELERATLTRLKHATTKLFKFPQSLFLFLDSIKPGNGKTMLTLYHQTLTTADPEMIFFMLIRQFRFFLALYQESEKNIDEVKRLADWQKSKLKKQASLFSDEALKMHYHQLYQLDLAQKTGSLALSLTSSIDLFLLQI